jgi:uncharacterized protein (DUF2062 family)
MRAILPNRRALNWLIKWPVQWLVRLRAGWNSFRVQAAQQVRRGISPRRLALTLALGFVLGCIPVIGIPTALCAMVAILFRLNLPAMQAANYAAMPFQVALIVPLARMGRLITIRIVPFAARKAADLRATDISALTHSPMELIRHSSAQFSGRLLEEIGLLAGQALVAWLVVAVPVVLLLTVALTGLLRRVPALAQAE